MVIGLSSGGPAPLPLPGIGRPARSGDPFAYLPGRGTEFTDRAVAGSSHVLFAKSPGGVLATAARVERFARLIDAVARGSGIEPRLLEAVVFLESAGLPDAIAGPDPSAAAGLMGIGNLQSVLDAYDNGAAVPYVQLYFDTAPDHHGVA